MCDVGETRVLANGSTSPSVLAKLRRPSCDEEPAKHQDKSNGTSSPSRSTPSTPTSLRRIASLEKCFSDPEFFEKQRQRQQQRQQQRNGSPAATRRSTSSTREATSTEPVVDDRQRNNGAENHQVITNGSASSDEYDGPHNGKERMAPVLGVPPPPPPAPHMGPDGLILPRKPYNPCLTSTNHKDLHRELLFNQKMGKNVLNQKSELQRALERHREMVSRKEAEREREETYKSDPRTALQRAIEQRAKHIQQSQQPQPTEPLNPLATARAKLRSRTESQ
ncbi:leiomodin-2 isoform X2 [Phymastichus coffea]|uniref:leiomodin-2 isoform X2 n=1 Tax=Phymastichus coffea TaxID=108790 RepID=UPI00273C50FD|nr:leiomodin-2 isoform X2 [Phymastichus coffea]